jgi:hypothetical protein
MPFSISFDTALVRGGGDSGIRTPDLRIMMKIAPIINNEINGLQAQNPAV